MAFALAAVSHAGVYDDALNRYNHTDYSGAAFLLKGTAENAQSLQLLGRCYLMDAHFSAAAAALEKAAALEPNNSMTFTWLARVYGRRAETSFAFAAMKDAVRARQTFEKAVRLDPRNFEAVNDLFEFYLQAPGILGGGVDKARSLLPLIARNDPSGEYFAQARIAEIRKEYPAAESQLRRAAEMAPQSAGRNLDLAGFLFTHGKFSESEVFFEKAQIAEPAGRRILFVRAQCYIHAKRDLEQARDLLKRYIAANDLTPDDPPRTDAVKLLKQSEGM